MGIMKARLYRALQSEHKVELHWAREAYWVSRWPCLVTAPGLVSPSNLPLVSAARDFACFLSMNSIVFSEIVPRACSRIWWGSHMTASVHFPFWFFCSVIGLPGEEDWPRDVALPRQAFQSKSAQPIEKFVTDIDELGKDLLLVSSRNVVGLWNWMANTVYPNHTI